MSIKAYKLVTGEEIIGTITEETPEEVNLKNVLIVATQYTQDGKASIGFVPFMPYIPKDSIIKIKTEKVIFSNDVDDIMINQYNSVFGKIVTPSKKLIVG